MWFWGDGQVTVRAYLSVVKDKLLLEEDVTLNKAQTTGQVEAVAKTMHLL